MRIHFFVSSTLTPAILTATTLGLSGCSQPTPPAPAAAAKTAAPADHDDHDHAEPHAHGDHEHGDGPHGGTLADWGGGKYHVEFTVDHDAKQATIYLLGADETTPTPVTLADGKLLLTIREPAFQVELVARPLDGEADATASRYVGTHDSLGMVRDFAGTISGAIDGTPYAGDFEEHAHEYE